MKTDNTKRAVIVFIAIVAFDAAWYFLWHGLSSSWLGYPIGGISFVINLPALLLMHLFEGLFQNGSLGMSGLFIGSLLFSAALWSLLAGYVFHRKSAA
jgi:hypothetical protein